MDHNQPAQKESVPEKPAQHKSPILIITIIVIVIVIAGFIYYAVSNRGVPDNKIPENVLQNLSKSPTNNEIPEEVLNKLSSPQESGSNEIPADVLENLSK